MRRWSLVALAVGLTTAAGVTAFAGEAKTIKGEVIDTYCYAIMGAKGESHRKCGLACAAKGIPVGLLENGTNKVYVLLPKEDKAPVPKEAVDKMGQQATITGKVAVVGGTQFLTVESVR